MKRRRSIWPTYSDRNGNIIPAPVHQSNFTGNLQKAWKLKGHLPKPKKGKWKPQIPAYTWRNLIKEWTFLLLFTGVVCCLLFSGILS
jgi:hypothetical protein